MVDIEKKEVNPVKIDGTFEKNRILTVDEISLKKLNKWRLPICIFRFNLYLV